MRTWVCHVPVDALTMEESIQAACALITNREPKHHVSINAAQVLTARRDPDFREILARAAIANADGQSIVWASRLLGQRVPERVAGIDFMLAMWGVAANRGYRVYLLGAKPHTVERVAETARSKGVCVVGARSGYWAPEEEDRVVAEVAHARPDLLFVGLPSPRKEKFWHHHASALGVPLTVGVGGSFDVVAGEVTRAPRWMQRSGLEWAHRLRQEPARLARRYLVGNLAFACFVLTEWLRNRANRPERRGQRAGR